MNAKPEKRPTIAKQNKQFRVEYHDKDGQPCVLVATVRHDDDCRNGHNTFSITADLYDRPDRLPGERSTVHAESGTRLWCGTGGCLHDEVTEHIPELAPFIKWHLCSTDGPLYYIANTIYHASDVHEDTGERYFYLEGKLIKICKPAEVEAMRRKYGANAEFKLYPNPMAHKADIEAARNCAVWPDATLEQLRSEVALQARLPALLVEFRKDVESLGLTF